MKFLFSFLFFLLQILVAQSQEYIVSGVVEDIQTGDRLAFVNILINDTREGGTTGIDGRFCLKSSQPVRYLRCSYVGYIPVRIDMLQHAGNIVIKMQRNSIELSAVTITPGENPAHRIIAQAIANRRENDPESYPEFSYTSYNKMFITADLDSLRRMDTQMLDTTQKKTLDFFNTQHLFLMESVSERYFKSPDKSQERIIASRVSGFSNPMFTLLATQMQSFSFYKDFVSIFDKVYINPISPGSLSRYLFLLKDTLYSGNDTVFVISFQPARNTHFDGLKGVLYINTHGFAIQNVIAEPAEANAAFSVKIQQKYELIEDKRWFPIQLNTDFMMANVMINNQKLVGINKSYLSNISLDPGLKNRRFGAIQLYWEPGSNAVSEEKWKAYRVDSLSAMDLKTYKVIDSLGKAEKFDKKLKTTLILFNGQVPFKIFNIDLKHLILFNNYEGWRPGFGLHTGEKLSRLFTIGGYGAIGFKDENWKYGCDAEIIISRLHEMKIRAEAAHDVEEAGGFNPFVSKSLLDITSFRNVLVNRMTIFQRQSISFEVRWLQYLKIQTGFSRSLEKVSGNYEYGLISSSISVTSNEFLLSEAWFRLRFAYREKFIELPGLKLSNGTKYPVVQFYFGKGFNGFAGGNYSFQRYQTLVAQSFIIPYIGKTDFQIDAGSIEKPVPYSLLHTFPASWEPWFLYVPNSFNTMRMGEFSASRYFSAHLRHNFGSLLYKTKKFRPELTLCSDLAFGKLHQAWRHRNIALKSPEKGFFESGLVVDKLLDMKFYSLGFGAFYRYGPYSENKALDNLFLRFSLKVSM